MALQRQQEKKSLLVRVFPTELEAAEARDLLAVELYGEDARLNFPEDLETHLKTIADRSIIPDECQVHPQETLHIYREAAEVMGVLV